MRTRCIHQPSDLCSRCQARITSSTADDRDWVKDPATQDWVYCGLAAIQGGIPRFQGPQSTAGPDMSTWPVVEGVRIAPTHVSYEPVRKPVKLGPMPMTPTQPGTVHYNATTSTDLTIRQMPTDLTNEQVAELRAQLDTALNSATQWQQLANSQVVQHNGTPVTQQVWNELKRNYDKLWVQLYEKKEPTTQSKMEVEKMTEMRIGDSERNAYIEHLGNMFANGNLNEAEFGERSDKANAAKTLSELRPLVADLPPMPSKDVAVPKAAVQRKPLKTWLAQTPTPVFFLTMGGFIAVIFLLLVLVL